MQKWKTTKPCFVGLYAGQMLYKLHFQNIFMRRWQKSNLLQIWNMRKGLQLPFLSGADGEKIQQQSQAWAEQQL